jgi:replicative DNA helicase
MDRYARDNWESELLGILVNYPELIDKLNFAAEYFKNKHLGKVFNYMKLHKELNPELLLRELEDDEITLLVDIYTNNIYDQGAETMAVGYARLILEAYKKESIDLLEHQRRAQLIDTNTYFLKLQEVNDLSVESNVEILTDEELEEIILDDKKGIMISRFEYLSSNLKLDSTDLVTVAGVSGFGKSAFLLNLYQSLSQDVTNGFKCQYFNLEVAPKVMIKRILAITSKRKMDEFNKDNLNEGFVIDAKKAIQNDSFIKSGSMTIEQLKAIMLNNLDKDKQNVIFIDHIGLLGTDEKSYNKNDFDRTTYCIKELRKLCLDHNVLMFVASQFDRESVKSKNISMHSLKSSGELENSSTHVLLLKESTKCISNNKTLYEEVMIDIAKNRNGPINQLDYYTFQKEKQFFKEAFR